jgi:hypothetical protein
MGHVSNPIGLRVGKNRSWCNKLNNSMTLYLSNMFPRYIKKYMNVRRFARLGLVLSHTIVLPRANNPPNIIVFIYDGAFQNACVRFFQTIDQTETKKYTNLYNILVPNILSRIVDRPTTAFQPNVLPLTYKLIRSILYKKYRKFFWESLANRLKQIIGCNLRIQKKKVNLTFEILTMSNITAKALVNFAMRDFKLDRTIMDIVNPIIKYVSNSIWGICLQFFGRFNRRQRATSDVYRVGSVPRRTFKCDIDYVRGNVPLRFGVGSIHISINKGFSNSFKDLKFLSKNLRSLSIPIHAGFLKLIKRGKKKKHYKNKILQYADLNLINTRHITKISAKKYIKKKYLIKKPKVYTNFELSSLILNYHKVLFVMKTLKKMKAKLKPIIKLVKKKPKKKIRKFFSKNRKIISARHKIMNTKQRNIIKHKFKIDNKKNLKINKKFYKLIFKNIKYKNFNIKHVKLMKNKILNMHILKFLKIQKKKNEIKSKTTKKSTKAKI